MENNINTPEKKFYQRKSFLFMVFGLLCFGIMAILMFRKSTVKKKDNPVKKVVTEEISTNFRTNKFTEGQEYKILAELGICDTTRVGDELGACSPKYFRFFPLNHKKKLSESCMILVNGIAYTDPGAKFPIRRTLVFEKEGGKWVSVNKFKGYIIGRRDVPNSDYDDIVMRFRLDEYDEAYHVVYTWKKGKYQFSHCEELFTYYNKGKVRKEMVDSVSREVEKILVEEGLVF
jgi:hypothetical protein